MEERYVKITSCNGCEFVGHRTDCNEKKPRINFCVNPANIDVIAIDSFMYQKQYYPVTSKTNSFGDCPIPTWCKLPKKVSE